MTSEASLGDIHQGLLEIRKVLYWLAAMMGMVAAFTGIKVIPLG